jgi:signal transduction histidine kinase
MRQYNERPSRDENGASRRSDVAAGEGMTLPERITRAAPQWPLGFMLLALHAAMAWDISGWWARAFLLVHFGLFLLWQPVWRGEREVEPRQSAVVIGFAIAFVGWYNWWLMAVWVAVLFAVIGGSVPRISDRPRRLISTLAASYLLAMLLVWVVPKLFTVRIEEPAVDVLVRYGLPLLPATILFIRVPAQHERSPVGVDLVYSVLFFLLVVALALGSFVVREVSQGAYVIALAQTLLGIGALLVALSWLWYPHSGFAGVGYLLSMYLMSLGLPFERWVQRLSELAQEERNPQRFLVNGVQHMLDMPWVRGVEWQTAGDRGEFGTRTSHVTEVAFGDLRLRIHTRWAASPAILLHLKLLAQMLGHFYEAKQREEIQRQSAYTHAIYETGARLTHDVKNLLQSLQALCAAVASSGPEQAGRLQALVQRQLPQITQRLNTTLDKLKAPTDTERRDVDGASWWRGLLQRYSGRNVELAAEGPLGGISVPPELFDSVADNLIENALNKALDCRDLTIRVIFSTAAGGSLRVHDTGTPVPKTIAAQLFEGAVHSNTGLGVGLYQSSRLAKQYGYRLALESNSAGNVCFVLTREATGASRN